MGDLYGQCSYGVRLDWGVAGALASAADVTVVVDVLSFSTSVTIAVGRGMDVLPYRWGRDDAARFALEHDAVLAVGRLEATTPGAPRAPSLSPAELLTCDVVRRLVLPSPNGSTIVTAVAQRASHVLLGCLRNASAVAAVLGREVEAGRSVAVVAAGERWPDDSLRPALEDHLGAGVILARLADLGHGRLLSPEARAALAVFEAHAVRLPETLRDCVGGRELAGKGFGADVEVAAVLDASSVVPHLVDGVLVAAGP
ncbi:hypothetical protein GCM10027425_01770 [Alteromonas gracilis]